MALFKQIHGQVAGGVDHAVAVFLAEVRGALGEKIEGAFRHVDLEARDLLGETHDQVAAAFESLAHLFYAALVGIPCKGCGLLADGARTAGVLALELVAALDDPLRSGHETDSPAGHCVSLGDAVDDDGTLAHALYGCDGSVLAHIVDVLIDLICKDIEVVVLLDDLCQCGQFFCGIDRTGRVARRAEDDHLGLGGDDGFQLGRGDLEVSLDLCLDVNRSTFCQLHHLRIADPVRCGDDHFVARVDQCEDCVADALFCTVGGQDLVGAVVQVVLAGELVADGLLQVRIARDRGVTGPVVVDGLLGGIFDVVGGIEIRFADGKVDDIDALCLQLAAALRHSQRCRGRELVQTV